MLTTGGTVARKKQAPKVEKKGETQIRVSAEVADALRKVCALENLSAAEFADRYYMPIIQERYKLLIVAENKRIGGNH